MTSYNRSYALIVDDDHTHVDHVGKVLAEEGMEFTHVHTGRSAQTLLRERSFGIVIVDENLPDIGGLEISAFVGKTSPKTSVILTTRSHSLITEKAAESQGVSEYLTKPINGERLRLRIRRLMMHSYPPPMPAKVPSRPPPPSKKDTPLPEPTRKALSDLRVVVVEPEGHLRMLLMEILAAYGCKTSAFRNARMAEAQVKQVGFDLLVADPGIVSSGTRWRTRRKEEGRSGVIAVMQAADSSPATGTVRMSTKGVLLPPFDKWSIKPELSKILRNIIQQLDALRK